MKIIRSLRNLWPILVLYGLLLIVLFTTNPFSAPLPVVMVPFVLLFMALSISFWRLLKLIPAGARLPTNRQLFVACGAAWLPVMLLILRSIDQLALRDAFILTIFMISFLLYVMRSNFGSS